MAKTLTTQVLCSCSHPRHHHHIGAQRPCAVEGCECADYNAAPTAKPVTTIVKHTRVETRERNGRIREATVTTWDLVDGDTILGEFTRKRDAVDKLCQLVDLVPARAEPLTDVLFGNPPIKLLGVR